MHSTSAIVPCQDCHNAANANHCNPPLPAARILGRLHVGSLAFEHVADGHEVNDQLGILVGSLLSAVAGYFFLRAGLRAPAD